MDIFRIEGPVRISGTVTVNGSKNASLPIMAAGGGQVGFEIAAASFRYFPVL
jgi:hypothetical protein